MSDVRNFPLESKDNDAPNTDTALCDRCKQIVRGHVVAIQRAREDRAWVYCNPCYHKAIEKQRGVLDELARGSIEEQGRDRQDL